MAVLFFYGTLRDAEVRCAVTGRDIPVETAWLPGFRCVPVRGRSYPMLIPDRQGRAEGVLAQDVGPAALRRLIGYEGPEYRLATATTVFKAGALPVKARLFMTRPGVAGDDSRSWDLQDWQESRKKGSLSRMPDWR